MKARWLPMVLWLAAADLHGASAADAKTLTVQGLGRLRIGMSYQSFRALHLRPDDQLPTADPARDPCAVVTLADYPGVLLMFEDRKLTRLDVTEGPVRTEAGLGIGSTEREARQVYGSRLKIAPNFYDASEHDLTALSKDGRFGTVYVTDGTRITSFRAGYAASIAYVEGCE